MDSTIILNYSKGGQRETISCDSVIMGMIMAELSAGAEILRTENLGSRDKDYRTLSMSCFSFPKKRPPEDFIESVVDVDVVVVVLVDVSVVVVVVDVVGVTDVLVDVTVVVVLGVLDDDARLVGSWARSKLDQSTPRSFPSEAILLYGLTLLR